MTEMSQDVLESVLLKLKDLEIRVYALEGNVRAHGIYLDELETEHEEATDNVEKLNFKVTHIDRDLKLCAFKRIEELEKNIERDRSAFKRIEELEKNEEIKKEKRKKFLEGLRNLEKRLDEYEDHSLPAVLKKIELFEYQLKNQHEEFVNQLQNTNREYDEKYTQSEWQNEEIRRHLNMTIDSVNNIMRVVNNIIDQQTTLPDEPIDTEIPQDCVINIY